MCVYVSHDIPVSVHPFFFFQSNFPSGEGHYADRRDAFDAGRGDGGRRLQRGAAARQRGTLAGAGTAAENQWDLRINQWYQFEVT